MRALPEENQARNGTAGRTMSEGAGTRDNNRGKEIVQLVMRRAWAAVRARKTILIIGMVATGIGAFLGAWLLSKPVWQVDATLVYSPLPIPEDAKSLYIPPDLKTLASLVNSPKILETAREASHIELPVKLIDQSLTTSVPGGTKALKMTLKWDNGVAAANLLNRIVAEFISQVASLRRAKLSDHVKDFEEHLVEVKGRLESALEEVRAFHRREGLVDFKNDVDTGLKKLGDLELSMGQQQRNESDILAQQRRMKDHFEEIKAQEAKEVEEEKQLQAATESISDNRRRQDRLRELIDEERRVQEIQAMIDIKKLEADRVRRLVLRGAASKSELEAIESEIAVFVSRIKESDKIKKWRGELEKIDKLVVPDAAKKRAGSPIIQQMLYRQLEIELHLIGIRDQMSQIQKGIDAQHARLKRLDQLRGEYESLTRKVESIDLERQKFESLIAVMRGLIDIKTAEFFIANVAEPPKYPSSSNKKLLLIGLGGSGMMLTLLTVAVLELGTIGRSTEARACQLGLPAIAWIAPPGRPYRRQQLRGLALRLRQFVPEPGAVVVFSTLSEPGQAEETIEELATLLALRDERVLILDARIGIDVASRTKPAAPNDRAEHRHASPPLWSTNVFPIENDRIPVVRGLSDYLAFVTSDLDEVCQPSTGFGVDRISLGHSNISADTMATHRMSELLTDLRARYSIILVIAPPLAHSVDLQILASQAQGVVAVVDLPVPVHRAVRRTIAELHALCAPILGQVVFEVEE